jgi:hypothetical protein
VAELLAGHYDATAVIGSIDTGDGPDNQALAMSHDGRRVAVACSRTNRVAILDTATDEIFDVAPDRPEVSQLHVPPEWEPSSGTSAVAWSEDDAVVYAGYLFGHPSGRLSGHGVVRKCPLDIGRCLHEVGVRGSVRSLALTGLGADRLVWVGDSQGLLTALPDRLFEPSPATTGTDLYGRADGTGGCIVDTGSVEKRARYCEPMRDAGQPVGAMIIP